jgi:hypothetical protein
MGIDKDKDKDKDREGWWRAPVEVLQGLRFALLTKTQTRSCLVDEIDRLNGISLL